MRSQAHNLVKKYGWFPIQTSPNEFYSLLLKKRRLKVYPSGSGYPVVAASFYRGREMKRVTGMKELKSLLEELKVLEALS